MKHPPNLLESYIATRDELSYLQSLVGKEDFDIVGAAIDSLDAIIDRETLSRARAALAQAERTVLPKELNELELCSECRALVYETIQAWKEGQDEDMLPYIQS